MEATPIEAHMRAALRMRVLRDVEIDEARRWSAVFGRATDDQARDFLRRQVEPHITAARGFNRLMIKAQREIRECLAERVRAAFATERGGTDGHNVVAGSPACIQREEENARRVRSIERAPAIVDGLVAIVLGRADRARDVRVGDRVADDGRSGARAARGGDSRRRRQASRLIAFLCALGAAGSSSGCATIGARPWSELSTGERVLNVALVVGTIAFVAHQSGAAYVSTGNARSEPCAVGDPCSNPSPTIPCVFPDRDLPPGCSRN